MAIRAVKPTRHTPGPWTYIPPAIRGASRPDHMIRAQGCTVAEVICQPGGIVEANAYLITAAPEMLEAAKDARALMQSVAPHPLAQALLQRIEAAIAKAEGR